MCIVVKNIVDEDFLQYKKPSMFVGFSRCNFKCGHTLCQNSALAKGEDIYINSAEICERYCRNDITKAIVLGGLDPFDTPEQCLELCMIFRCYSQDDIVIYTGYTEEELDNDKGILGECYCRICDIGNVIIKYGRYIPNQTPHYDPVLGVNLVSDNQYAKAWEG